MNEISASKHEEDKFTRHPVLNVWGFKSPMAVGDTFTAQVRVKVFDGQSLEGASIKVVDPKTGKVLASSRVGTSEDTEAGMLQDSVTLQVPDEPGMHKYTAVLDDGSNSVPAQLVIPFSAVPEGNREIVVKCFDDKSQKPVKARVFLYNTALDKTKPIDVRADADGIARAKIVPGVDYKIKAVCEDYVISYLDIPAEGTEGDTYDLPMRFVFNVKIKKPF